MHIDLCTVMRRLDIQIFVMIFLPFGPFMPEIMDTQGNGRIDDKIMEEMSRSPGAGADPDAGHAHNDIA